MILGQCSGLWELLVLFVKFSHTLAIPTCLARSLVGSKEIMNVRVACKLFASL